MSSHLDNISAFLERYEWKYEIVDDRSIITGFSGETSTYTLFIKLSDDWVIFSISPFVKRPSNGCRENLLRYLANLNFHALVVKFSIDDDENIVLTLELPINELNYSPFIVSLETLCFYAEQQFQQISDLSQDPLASPPTFINS